MHSQPLKYRKRPVEVEEIHYMGEFPLEFLRDDEQVRAARCGRLKGDVLIESPSRNSVFLAVGYMLIREANGTLTTSPDRDLFDATYEPIPQGHSVEADDLDRELFFAIEAADTHSPETLIWLRKLIDQKLASGDSSVEGAG
jgi:hypothetical protein